MKNPIHKSNIRRPLKGILLLIILLIASNLFISSISQFFIINREINDISRYYRSVGTITWNNDNYDVKEAQEIIAGDLMIDFEDNRRNTIGVIDGLYKTRRNTPSFGQSTGENSLDLIFVGEIKEAYKSKQAEDIYEGSLLAVKVTDILAGVPNFIEGDIMYKYDQEHHIGFLSHSIVTGEKYEYINDDIIDDLFELEPGKKYIFRAVFERTISSGTFAKPLYEGGPLYIELDDSGSIDWNDPQFKIIKEEIDFINENIVSYDLIGTKDMTAMLEVQDGSNDFYLVEGRWINNEDNENQNHVIIIQELLAEMYDINIGDKLEITMRDSEYGGALFSEKDKKEWKTYYTSEPKSFEVVGIFESNVYPTAYSDTMYIPESTIPIEFGRYTRGLDEPIPFIYPHLYSFVLKNPEDESAFIEKYKESLEELGYKINFVVNNIENFLETSAPIKRSTAISLLLFSILLILIQGFVVYVYVDGHKLNYAIERALGIPAKVSGKHLIQTLIIFGSIASVIGGYIGYKNAIEKSAELLGELAGESQRIINSGLDIKHLVLFILLSMIPFMIMLLIRIKQLKNASVIDLINDNKRKKVAQGEVESYEMAKATTISTETETYTKQSENNKKQHIKEDKQILTKNSQKALKRFSLNHTLRSKVTSMLLIVLAGIFTFSLLWMNYLNIKNNELIEKAYKDYIITGDIVAKSGTTKEGTGLIDRKNIDDLMETELVEDYESIALMIYDELYINRDGTISKYEIGEKDKVHFITDDPKFVVNASNKSLNSPDGIIQLTELNFMEGYSLEDLDKTYIYTSDNTKSHKQIIADEEGKEGFSMLVSDKAMEHFDLELGDKIFLKPNSENRPILLESYGTIIGNFQGVDSSKDYYGHSTMDDEELFIYPISVLNILERKVYYNKIELEFKPEKNKELMERKEELRKIVLDNSFRDYPLELRLWDGELTNVIEPLEKNLSLLEVLYPITFILSIVIAGILSFIMVLRRTLDVAILRVLGVKEKEVRKSLFMENIILTLIGIFIGNYCWFNTGYREG
jgi:ABC-type antimicrobial peptide transport system permease subunit